MGTSYENDWFKNIQENKVKLNAHLSNTCKLTMYACLPIPYHALTIGVII